MCFGENLRHERLRGVAGKTDAYTRIADEHGNINVLAKFVGGCFKKKNVHREDEW